MKKSIFLSFILCLCLIACIPQQAMAQKQSRMEKLLRYLNDNDADKWQKNREKLDDETKAYYAEDLSLMDVLNDLWNGQSEQAATLYFGCYEKAAQSNFPASAKGRKFRFLRYGTKRTSPLSTCWRPRKIKYLSAGHCWTAFTPPNIRLTPPCCNGCRTSARWHCWKECSKPPLPSSTRLTSRSIPTANLSHKSTPPKTYGSTNW